MRALFVALAILAGTLPAGSPAHAQITAGADATSAELRARTRGDIGAFYAARGFRPLWTAATAETLLDYLATADADGLRPRSYNPDKLRRSLAATDPAATAKADIALTRAFVRYVRDLRKPARNDTIWADPALEPKKLRDATILGAAAIPPDFAAYIADMAWMSPHYVRQRALLAAATDPEAARRITRNRDRARLLPGPWTHHIVVDAGSGRLWYYQAGRQAGTMKVVVGTPETPTPMLAGTLTWAILNPWWNVPVDLARTRIAPRVLAGRTLKAQRFEALSDWSATPRSLDPATIDWPAVAAGTQELRLRQLPGGNNAMGRVKFIFPNDEGIYLHDTPDRALFKAADRHFSNGCIRLEDATTLGRWLTGAPLRPGRTPEQPLALPIPVPIYLTYFTTPDGPDPYNRNP